MSFSGSFANDSICFQWPYQLFFIAHRICCGIRSDDEQKKLIKKTKLRELKQHESRVL